MLEFKIVFSRTEDTKDKKYVSYTLQVRQDENDPEPVNVERRYTHFLDLYNALKKDFPAILNTISFPRKIIVGNFDPALISTRCIAFEGLLHLIANDSRLRETKASMDFLQNVELQEAKRLLEVNEQNNAMATLETSFKLLNKVYTDRSSIVLCALCRVVACASSLGKDNAQLAERWANLALRRYEAVSDSDLLSLYVPLLHTCINIWEMLEKDKSNLVTEVNDLRKRGMKVNSLLGLMDAVDQLNPTI